jgi:D-3-phosphoglycerate dehydrogenase
MLPLVFNAEPDLYSAQAEQIIRCFARYQPLQRQDIWPDCLHEADILITRLGFDIDRSVLASAANLKAIVTSTTGLNHIDLEYAVDRKIAVLSLKGETEFLRTVTATAEHTWALLLALVRNLKAADQQIKSYVWDRQSLIGHELQGQMIGIVGFGRLGQRVATYAHAFGMQVMAYDRAEFFAPDYVQKTDLNDLIAHSDVITLHISGEPENSKFWDERKIAQMKSSALLINTSRGHVIDEYALLEALQKNALAGAALDVLADESGEGSSWMRQAPLVDYANQHDNLILTPHIGGATFESLEKTEIFMAKKLKTWWQDQHQAAPKTLKHT